ncbi:MAG TPA: type 1 glutamine amidotransferase [Cytophagaceae bacterium]
MNIHYFQHVPFEGLGWIENWAKVPGNTVTATKVYEDTRLPFVDLFDVLVVMGGPMGATEDDLYPWMKEEKKLIEKAILKGKRVIGICLGAQLIADVLGARIFPNKVKEIGWHPIELTEEGQKSTLFSDFNQQETVFHWHGDTFETPKGAEHIARSSACENQAFIFDHKVLGLQFHLESTPASIQKMLENCKGELVEGPYIQSEQDILSPTFMSRNNQLLEGLLNRFCKDAPRKD